MRRILVTGRGGQLATGLADALPAQGFEAILVGQPEFEFDEPETVAAAFASNSGLRYGATARKVTSCNRSVTPAAAASATNGSSVWWPPLSANQR